MTHRHLRRGLLLLFIITCLAGSAFAAPKISGQPWLDMDYGPFKATTIEAPTPAGNFAYKGIAVHLGGPRNATVCFDTDTLRYSVGWLDGWLNLSGVVYDGKHWAYPTTNGPIVFSNGVGPGWGEPGRASDALFHDPRFRGHDDKPYGPLPHKWGHWKGLYVYGDKVVLSYTIGSASVLELPGVEDVAGNPVFTRTFNIRPSSSPMVLQVAAEDGQTLTRVPIDGDAKQPSLLLAVLGSTDTKRSDAPIAPPAQEKAQAPAQVQPATTDAGLIGYWTFDAQQNGAIANERGKPFALQTDKVELVAGVKEKAINLAGGAVIVQQSSDLHLGRNDHTIAAWIRTTKDGTILAKAPAEGAWKPQGRTLFIRGGRLTFDVGWVGNVQSSTKVNDNKWHHVAATFDKATSKYRLYVDGKLDGEGELKVEDEVADHVVKVGFTSDNFPRGDNHFRGAIDDLRVYNRTLTDADIAQLAGAEVPPAAATPTTPATTTSTTGQPLLLGCIGGPEGTTFQGRDGAALLMIPPHDGDLRLKLLVARGDQPAQATLVKAMRGAGKVGDLTELTKGGPARYPQTLTTKGTLGERAKDAPYAIDTLTWPADNPWHSWMRFGGFDFFKDGKRAAICTWSGDVWIVSGIDQDLKELKWQRIATGMFQPLGVKIVDEKIYVCCRDQITRLVDLNGDGETDFYENFNNDHQVTEHFHEFAMDLQTDAQGNFYYAKSARHARDSLVQQHGTLLRVSPDGKTTTIVANGYRAANGVGVGPNGEFFTSDQEGHWMPANRINLVREGSFSGNMYSYHMGEKPTDYDRPIVWLPKSVDRSPAEQVWVSSDKWGLPRGSLISLSYGTGYIQNVMYEKIEGLDPRVYAQGAFHRLLGPFPTGIMRGRFHPDDGQLYACGLFGWSSQVTGAGGFYRVRYTGGPVNAVVSFKVARDGVVLRFTDPLDRAAATDAERMAVQQWEYKWTANYGSPEFKSDLRTKGHDDIDIEKVHLSKDARTMWIEIPDLQPSMQISVRFDLKSAAGEPITREVYGSVHVVPDRSGADLLEQN